MEVRHTLGMGDAVEGQPRKQCTTTKRTATRTATKTPHGPKDAPPRTIKLLEDLKVANDLGELK